MNPNTSMSDAARKSFNELPEDVRQTIIRLRTTPAREFNLEERRTDLELRQLELKARNEARRR